MKIHGKIEGVNQFQELLEKLPDRVQKNVLQRATLAAMRIARPSIKAAAPVDQGERSELSKKYKRLRQNIRVGKIKNKKKTERGAILNTGNAPWGYWQEKGTRYIPANPWFEPAWKAIQHLVLKTLNIEMGKGIEGEAGKLMKGKRK